MDPVALLREARTILLIDWPSRDVPESLARAGLMVVADEGPGRVVAYVSVGDLVAVNTVAVPPATVDIVYAYRPLDELPQIVERARSLEARAVWLEGLAPEEVEQARPQVEAAGFRLLTEPFIADAARVGPATE